MRRIAGWTLLGLSFVACPCHLPLTLGLLLGVTGGSALGSFLTRNTGLAYGVATASFLLALGVGWYLVARQAKGCGVNGWNRLKASLKREAGETAGGDEPV